MQKGNLYLVPSLLGDTHYNYSLPNVFSSILKDIKYFIVEDIRTARRFLKYGGFIDDFQDVTFYVLNKHTTLVAYTSFLDEANRGHHIALISEAGCPCVADPGALIVEMAHKKNIKVIPLVGPSSIILSLMASGLNGQNFSFLGYLPLKQAERIKKLKELEVKINRHKETQIFIETPYRNQQLLGDILRTMPHNFKLCIACDITLDTESILTRSVADWKKQIPQLNKRQVVFLLNI